VSPALVVLAKAPVAGRSKTRLTPPCTAAQAAALAEAALADTLEAVAATPARRRVVVLEGEPGAWLPGGFEVVAQRGGGLGERLANAFADVGGPALLIGMDTPQVTPALLRDGAATLRHDAVDAALGLAGDGGYWAIGLREPDAALFAGVTMSEATTGATQRARLDAAGLRVAALPELRDVDTIDDARAVAALAPEGRFARALAAVSAAGPPRTAPAARSAAGPRRTPAG
jgi:rSAM/selenodomain-associated transferase 1